ncbi:aminotransferase class IV [Corynebacterium choanae]|uniref:4-amino-4-deoxychorismate lyase n=1 Tax=Corynebacterium choanae TaxID=1862358 RepID=A0A3G6J4G2_9CORY|nr:aminotransferase class IV [Corynebacterium choanae]AZA12792.1 4-amino-4-deoxychorismate lyase [Corynebacterium choanae]
MAAHLPAVMTSFRMINNRVCNFPAHLTRLAAHRELSREDEHHIRLELLRLGPAASNPKVEYQPATGNFVVTRRPDRPIPDTLTLWGHPITDQRIAPTVKGPDLMWLAGCQAQARRHHSDEALLCDDQGFIVEANYASIVCFTGPDTITISGHPRALASTTLPAVVHYLTGHGYQVDTAVDGLQLAQLRAHPVWLINAFAGVREVTHWREYATTAAAPRLTSPSTMIHHTAVNRWLWRNAQSVAPTM